MSSLTALGRRTSSPTFRLPTTIIQIKVKFSINCSKVKMKVKPIYKSSKSKWTLRNRELPRSNEKLAKREIPNTKKPKDKLQFPNKEQDLLQSSEMPVILETSKFKTRLARSHKASIMSVPTMSNRTSSTSTSILKRRSSSSRQTDTSR